MSAIMILLVIAAICFFIAAIPLPFNNPVNLTALGLFFFTLTFIIR